MTNSTKAATQHITLTFTTIILLDPVITYQIMIEPRKISW